MCQGVLILKLGWWLLVSFSQCRWGYYRLTSHHKLNDKCTLGWEPSWSIPGQYHLWLPASTMDTIHHLGPCAVTELTLPLNHDAPSMTDRCLSIPTRPPLVCFQQGRSFFLPHSPLCGRHEQLQTQSQSLLSCCLTSESRSKHPHCQPLLQL